MDSAKVIGYGIGTLIAVPLVAVLVLYNGVAIWMLWGWFVVPLGMQQISLAWACGLAVFVNAIVSHDTKNLKAEYLERDPTDLFFVLLRPMMAIALGYILKQFM